MAGDISSNDGRVPLSTVLIYGPPLFALAGAAQFVQFFFLKFAADVLLIAPFVAGLIYMLCRLWDAVADPIIGFWSDRTKSRLGRRRPWMLGAIPILALTFIMVWLTPLELDETLRIAWVCVALFAFYSAHTAYMVPYQALGAELTRNHHDRSRIFGAWYAAFTAGTLVAFGGMQYVMTAEDSYAATGTLAIGLAVLLAGVMLVPPIGLREPAAHQGRGASSLLPALRDVLKNPHAGRLLAVGFIQNIPLGVLGTIMPFYMAYVIRRPDMIGTVPAVFVILNVLSVPLWVRLSRTWGKRRTWILGMVLCALGFGSGSLVAAGAALPLAVVLAFAGAGMGCGGTMSHSMLADVIDSDEHATGERKEGAYSAVWGFVAKCSVALVAFPTGLALQLAGFVPNVEQPPEVELVLRVLFGGLPVLGFLTGAFILRGFTLNEREHARIVKDLAARRSLAGDAAGIKETG